jgi:hypothetical protein
VRLLTNGTSVLVHVADVARRRELLGGRLHPRRLGAAVVLASGRCNLELARRRLARLADGANGTAVPRLVLVDEAALQQLGPDAAACVDAVLVLDPPVTAAGRDALVALRLPLHLAWGAGETRFALDVAAAAADVRATLGPAWKGLQAGTEDATHLERLLLAAGNADAPILHTPAAVSHALAVLAARGLVHVDVHALRVTTLDPARSAASA